MVKTLDFNKLTQPNLPLIFKDKDKTKIRVTSPTEGLVEELQAALPYLEKAFSQNDAETRRAVYDLAAKLMSCNLEGLAISAEDLRDKYKIGLEPLVVFYQAYLEFINDMADVKN